jgi:hypothetical protein
MESKLELIFLSLLCAQHGLLLVLLSDVILICHARHYQQPHGHSASTVQTYVRYQIYCQWNPLVETREQALDLNRLQGLH